MKPVPFSVVMAIAVILCACCGCHSIASKPLTSSAAVNTAPAAMMASDAYHHADRVKFPLEMLGWRQVDLQGQPTTNATSSHWFTGLAYDIFEQTNSNQAAFVIRGTDNKWDYIMSNLAIPISPAYRQAKNAYATYAANHPSRQVTVVGHSLGGGVALSISVRFGIPAIIFDSSPRVFDGLGDKHVDAQRTMVYEKGEILHSIRPYVHKIGDVLQTADVYECAVNFRDFEATNSTKNVSSHRADYLALSLLKTAAETNAELAKVYDAAFARQKAIVERP